MNTPQRLLWSLLQSPFPKIEASLFSKFNVQEAADFYIDVSFLISASEYLREGCWLEEKKVGKGNADLQTFIHETFESELFSLSFLHDFLTAFDPRKFRDLEKQAQEIEVAIIGFVLKSERGYQNLFVQIALNKMVSRFNTEATLQSERSAQGKTLSLTLYRTFDRLDEVLGLDYDVEKSVVSDLKVKERLYEGAGVGVQSSYSTLLTALREIKPVQNAKFIDLGSGYGRVGLVLGFLRPDIEFIGYEYVPQRVDVSKECSLRLGLAEHVHFFHQDLADRHFQIPEADVYYLYDPFSEDTYKYVLAQLVEISKQRRIVIATKGNAKGWLKDVALKNGWPAPQEFSEDNLCLFRSY